MTVQHAEGKLIDATKPEPYEALIECLSLEIAELRERTNDLIDVTNRQNDMLSLIVNEVKPTLDSLKSSPIGSLLGIGD